MGYLEYSYDKIEGHGYTDNKNEKAGEKLKCSPMPFLHVSRYVVQVMHCSNGIIEFIFSSLVKRLYL
jgi:hypothetical protein